MEVQAWCAQKWSLEVFVFDIKEMASTLPDAINTTVIDMKGYNVDTTVQVQAWHRGLHCSAASKFSCHGQERDG